MGIIIIIIVAQPGMEHNKTKAVAIHARRHRETVRDTDSMGDTATGRPTAVVGDQTDRQTRHLDRRPRATESRYVAAWNWTLRRSPSSARWRTHEPRRPPRRTSPTIGKRRAW